MGSYRKTRVLAIARDDTNQIEELIWRPVDGRREHLEISHPQRHPLAPRLSAARLYSIEERAHEVALFVVEHLDLRQVEDDRWTMFCLSDRVRQDPFWCNVVHGAELEELLQGDGAFGTFVSGDGCRCECRRPVPDIPEAEPPLLPDPTKGVPDLDRDLPSHWAPREIELRQRDFAIMTSKRKPLFARIP